MCESKKIRKAGRNHSFRYHFLKIEMFHEILNEDID